jgi:hypothetical protein
LKFINDIANYITHSIVISICFADGTQISIAVRSEQNVKLLQRDLENGIAWSDRNNMAINKYNFEYMCHKFNRHLLLYPTQSLLNQSYNFGTQELGVLASNDFFWSKHIRVIANKSRQKTSWVLCVFHARSTHDPGQKTFTSRITSKKDLHYWDQTVHLYLISQQRRREGYILCHERKILRGQTNSGLN